MWDFGAGKQAAALSILWQFPLTIVVLVVGFFAWTLTEYTAHRFAMHSVGGRGPAAKEHLMHHAEPDRTRFLIRTLGHLGMYTTAVLIGVVLQFVLPLAFAISLAIGWAVGYTAYEGLHWRAHHRPPFASPAALHAYDLRLRQRHFHHHFARPKENLGVMNSHWDRLFRTEVDPSRMPGHQIKVPRRLAMTWLVDNANTVRPEFADDYVIVGRLTRSEQQDQRDRLQAFADEAPSLR